MVKEVVDGGQPSAFPQAADYPHIHACSLGGRIKYGGLFLDYREADLWLLHHFGRAQPATKPALQIDPDPLDLGRILLDMIIKPGRFGLA